MADGRPGSGPESHPGSPGRVAGGPSVPGGRGSWQRSSSSVHWFPRGPGPGQRHGLLPDGQPGRGPASPAGAAGFPDPGHRPARGSARSGRRCNSRSFRPSARQRGQHRFAAQLFRVGMPVVLDGHWQGQRLLELPDNGPARLDVRRGHLRARRRAGRTTREHRTGPKRAAARPARGGSRRRHLASG